MKKWNVIPYRRQKKWGESNEYPVYIQKLAATLQLREADLNKAQHSLGELRKRTEFRENKGARNYKIGYQKTRQLHRRRI